VHRHGFYWRFVILPDGVRERVGVHRMRCAVCRRTISFLPDFCVPYKHFGCDVIRAVLWAVVVLNVSRRAASAWDSVWNESSFSRFCAGEWVRQFGCNSHNLWHFGLARLGLSVDRGRGSLPALLSALLRFGGALRGDEVQALRAVQCALSEAFPPFGLFRAQLLPGCCT
jgi:hypothetical protein